MELCLVDVNNPHASKRENQTKLYFQFVSENVITPMLNHMYASMHVSLMNLQSFYRTAAAAAS